MSSERNHPNPQQQQQCATTYVFPVSDLLAEGESSRSVPTGRTPIVAGTSSSRRTMQADEGPGAAEGDLAFRKDPRQQPQAQPSHFQIKFPVFRTNSSGRSELASSSRPPIDPTSTQNPPTPPVPAHSSSSNPVFNSSGQPIKFPIRSAIKGHNRSASHGGVMGPRSELPTADAGSSCSSSTSTSSSVATPLPSAMKKGHTRAASHGQIVEDSNPVKGHNRVLSKTDFTLPPGHVDRPSTGPVAWEGAQKKGHSRQASRTESIYTLRSHRGSAKRSKLFFWKTSPMPDAPKTRTIVPNHRVPPGTKHDQHPNGKYPTNLIRTTKYTLISFLPKNLFEQFHRFANLYFISIVLLNWIPAINAFGKEIAMLPVMFVLGVTAIKDLFEDRRRHNSDKRVNNAPCRIYNRELNRYVKVKCKNMRVGDIVHVGCNEIIPADILVLNTSDPHGLCYIETMNLDGENNLKQREVVRGFENQAAFKPNEFQSHLEVGPPTTKIYHFTGNMIHQNGTSVPVTKENLLLRDCTLKNTDYVVGLVVYAGRETKAMLNNGGPRHKRTGLEKMMNTEVMWCVVILAVMCIIGATGSSFFLVKFNEKSVPFSIPEENFSPAKEAFLSFLTFLILLQIMIPLSLYVTIELTKLMQIFHIQSDRELYDSETNKCIECRAMNIPEDLGQIQYVFSDKTGTLTENKMIFRKCTIGGVDFNHTQLPEEINQIPSSIPAPLIINPSLSELLGQLNVNISVDSGNMDLNFLSKQAQYTHDFFMILAVCNTVVVAKFPHHDKMNASGTLYPEESTTINPRLSPIRESLDSNSCNITYDQTTILVDLQPNEMDSETHPDSANTNEGSIPAVFPNSNTTGNSLLVKSSRRPGILSLLPSRPLSPISSSNETTPTESPAQRPRFLQIPSKLRPNRTLATNNNQVPGTATPSPSELRPIFEAESPDELALVEAAYAYQCKLFKRTPKMVRIAMPGEGLVEYEVLQIFPFDSVRKRMSIILRHPNSNQIILYCKGADSSVLARLKAPCDQFERDLLNHTETHMNNYARDGLRILVMAKRILTETEYSNWKMQLEVAEKDIHNRDNEIAKCFELLETNLQIVGATGIEDRLQEGVPEAIQNLRNAGLVVWVLTGDKQETAINISHSCKLFTPDMDIIKLNARSKESAEQTIKFYTAEIEKMKTRGGSFSFPTPSTHVDTQISHNNLVSCDAQAVENPPLTQRERALVIDGKTLTYVLDQRNSNLLMPFLHLTQQCSSVLCCRSTPLQKAYIVSSVKDKLKKRTLAIGDGANDVSMIQRADIGIGISGKEGMQAVMASDFAISKFRFLERLLLVHGHWCYDRLARLILYFFYKNAAFVFVIFWFQLLNGWSGSVMIDQMYLMVFNLFFTALPPMAIGIYDQDASDQILMSVPRLYRQGRLQKVHQGHSFWLNMIDALYESIVIFFMAYGAYLGSEVSLLEFGTTVVVSCMFTMLAHMAIEVKSWTILHIGSIVFSVVFFYAFAFIYNTICITCLGFENPYWVIHEVIGTWTHWLTIFVTIVLAVLPRFVIRILCNTIWPSDVTKALIMKRNNSQNKTNEELFATWSSTVSSGTDSSDKVTCVCWKALNEQDGDSNSRGSNQSANAGGIPT